MVKSSSSTKGAGLFKKKHCNNIVIIVTNGMENLIPYPYSNGVQGYCKRFIKCEYDTIIWYK